MSNTDPLPCSRRTLLKAAAGFAGTSLLGGLPFRAFAEATSLAPADRCFVFAYIPNGWDQLLALDPRDPRIFTNELLAETRIQPAYDLITDASFPLLPVTPPTRSGAAPSAIQFGPAIGDLARHYDKMTVVRGINMNTLAHEVGYRYFLTGKQPIGSAARGASTATEIVGQMKTPNPIPQIAYNIESYNDRFPGFANALKVARSSDLLLTLAAGATPLDSGIERELIDLRGAPVTCEGDAYDSRGLASTYGQSRDQMREVLSRNLANAFRFDKSTDPVLEAYRAPIRQAYRLPDVGPHDTPAGRAALVATALKQGVSQCVSINMANGNIDTHFGTQRVHAVNLRQSFNAIAALVEDLRTSSHPRGGTFLDHTTIVVFSEFSRTPLLNGSAGRDHHLCNSCAIIGAGFKHNFVYGMSGDIGMVPGTLDFRTGAADPSGGNIFPEQIIATVLASAGLDYSVTRVEPLRALLA